MPLPIQEALLLDIKVAALRLLQEYLGHVSHRFLIWLAISLLLHRSFMLLDVSVLDGESFVLELNEQGIGERALA